MTRLALWTVALLLAAGAAIAQVYKWVDEKGVTHYSESPPKGKKAQEVKLNDPTGGPAREAAAGSSKAAPAPPPVTATRRAPAARPVEPAPEEEGAKGAQAKGAKKEEDERFHLLGSWRTPPDERVQVSIGFSLWGKTDLVVGQQWIAEGKSDTASGAHFGIKAARGRGTLEARGKLDSDGVPTRINYALEGDELVLSLPSGPHSGLYRLRKVGQ